MIESESELSGNDAKLIDPICGMSVTVESEHHHAHNGADYYFCSAGCQHKFAKDPEQYINPITDEQASGDVDLGIYTCPMHPEVEQQGAGSCPKCGMALEAKAITVEEDNSELADMSTRFWISAALAFPVFGLAMIIDMAPALLPDALSLRAVQWLEFMLATPVVIWGGWPFFVRGIQSVISWTLQHCGAVVSWSVSRRNANGRWCGSGVF